MRKFEKKKRAKKNRKHVSEKKGFYEPFMQNIRETTGFFELHIQPRIILLQQINIRQFRRHFFLEPQDFILQLSYIILPDRRLGLHIPNNLIFLVQLKNSITEFKYFLKIPKPTLAANESPLLFAYSNCNRSSSTTSVLAISSARSSAAIFSNSFREFFSSFRAKRRLLISACRRFTVWLKFVLNKQKKI